MNTLTVNIADGTARVVLDNGAINLLDGQMFGELAAVVDQLGADEEVRVVVISSANPEFFIAHFDVTLIQTFPTTAPVEPATRPNAFQIMCENLRTMPKATIAVVEGRVGGGGSELALSCDMRFAKRSAAVFSQPEVALGIIPGGSGTVRLPRLIGRSRALEVILGCDDIDADLAEAWGWVNRTLDESELWPHVNELARRIASFPAHAVAAAKESVLRADTRDRRGPTAGEPCVPEYAGAPRRPGRNGCVHQQRRPTAGRRAATWRIRSRATRAPITIFIPPGSAIVIVWKGDDRISIRLRATPIHGRI